ncbi:zinc finger protein 528-like [Anopheles aquasalis]|uniref:zinc finger protein 528-like n=1 Tax=Anopheles aquasalis TaxID=42839 RepID=UPI00215A5901|nr:zinc finger protein 528-like [Anopheles aquasalis]
MDILIEPDCYKVCRICMESCEDDFVCVYDEFEDMILSDVITECARIEIRKHDALPRNACRNCAEYMIIAYHIIQKCRESDATLRSIFRHELNVREGERNNGLAREGARMRVTEDMDPSDYEFLLGLGLDGEPLLEAPSFTSPVDGEMAGAPAYDQPVSSLATVNQQQQHQHQEEEEMQPNSLSAASYTEETTSNDHSSQIVGEEAAAVAGPAEIAHESSETNEEDSSVPQGEQKKCCGCRKLFYNERSLLEHCRDVHLPAQECQQEGSSDDGKRLRCTVCYRGFSSLQLLKEHQRTVNRKYVCARCGKRFMTQANLDTHSKCHKDRETYKCCGCRGEFETELELLLHSEQVHRPERKEDSDKPFECETCFRRYSKRKSLVKHRRMARQFQCQTCGAIFMKQLFLTLHTESVHRQGLEQEQQSHQQPLVQQDQTHLQKYRCCGGCRDEFADMAALREHSERVHGKEDDRTRAQGVDRPFQCSICRKRFATAIYLLQHRSREFREKCFPCSICGRSFNRAHDLSNHQTTHSNEMPFECNVCGRRFKNKIYLKNHCKLHASSAKEHVCRQCGKCFRTKELLKTHHISHSQERKHGCTVCGAAFKRLQCLKIHTRVHTREKAYECTVCRKRYVQASDLKRHMLTHNPDVEGKPFQCEHCLRRYPRKDYLKMHVRRQHPEQQTAQPEPQQLPDALELFTAANETEQPATVATGATAALAVAVMVDDDDVGDFMRLC